MNAWNGRTWGVALAATALFLSTPVRALNPTVPQGGLPSATDFSAQILPERDGVVSWKTLAEVEPVKKGNKILPEFAKPILALDAKDQRVQGFMIPLDMGDKQRRFLLSAVPPHCSFCLPAGPEAVVEIVAKTPVAYTLEPIVVSGRFRSCAADRVFPSVAFTKAQASAAVFRTSLARRSTNRSQRESSTSPQARPFSVSRRSALSMRRSRRCSARDVNMR